MALVSTIILFIKLAIFQWFDSQLKFTVSGTKIVVEALDENFGQPSTGDQPPPPKKKCTQSAVGKKRKKLETEKETAVSAATKENKRPRIQKPTGKPANKPPTGTILKVSKIPPTNTPQIQTPATIPTSIVSPPLPLQRSKTPSPKPVRICAFSCNIIIHVARYTTFQCETNDPHFPLNIITGVPNQKHSYIKIIPKNSYSPI